MSLENVIIQSIFSQSAFYYHHVLAILNKVSYKVFLKKKIFHLAKFKQLIRSLFSCNYILCVSFKLAHFNNFTVSKHCILHGHYSESSQLFSLSPTHMELATHVLSENQFRTVQAVQNCVSFLSASPSNIQLLGTTQT